jgi:hypothetical protein
MTNPNQLTIAAARDALRKGEISAVDLTMSCLTAIDAGDDLALFYLGIEIGEHLPDLPRDLGADLHLYGGCQRARSGHGRSQRAAIDLGRAQLRLIAGGTLVEPPPCAAGKHGNHQQQTDQGTQFHEWAGKGSAPDLTPTPWSDFVAGP